jgi:hypothetical protein
MNLIDVSVEEILIPPHKVITYELCCWEVTIIANCYGVLGEKVIQKVSKKEIDYYKPGFTWME